MAAHFSKMMEQIHYMIQCKNQEDHHLRNRNTQKCYTKKLIKKARYLVYFATSSLAYCPDGLTSASFRMITHTELSSGFFLHLSTPINFRSFSVQSWSSSFLLPSGFFRNTFFEVLSSDILSSPFESSYFYCCYNIWFYIHNLQFIISFDFPAILIIYWAIHLS